MADERVPVLIVGGGLVGLTAALLLERYGVEYVLVERRDGTSPQPKARRLNMRSMEVYRAAGVAHEVSRAAAGLTEFQAMRAGRTMLTAEPLGPPGGGGTGFDAAQLAAIAAASPVDSVLCSQDVLEPVLRDIAVERGGDLRFGTEWISSRPEEGGSGSGVVARIRDRASGVVGTIRASYLIAADGAASPVRENLGVSRSGWGELTDSMTVYFRAELADHVRGREFNLCHVTGGDSGCPGAFASVNGTDRWVFLTDRVELSEGEWRSTLAANIGIPDVPIDILSMLPWQATMRVADTFRVGGIFLAGDAAHVMPPFAAAGANTGIADVHNLVWKIAAVLAGSAGHRLLDSYHTERHPAAWFAAEQSSSRLGRPVGDERPGIENQRGNRPVTPLADPIAMILGFQYPAGALIADEGDPAPMDRLELTGKVGTRVPHVALSPRESTVDYGGLGFALFTIGSAIVNRGGIVPGGLRERVFAPTDPWVRQVGLPGGGAMLVRPDGIVAWRSDVPADSPAALDHVLTTILARSEHVQLSVD